MARHATSRRAGTPLTSASWTKNSPEQPALAFYPVPTASEHDQATRDAHANTHARPHRSSAEQAAPLSASLRLAPRAEQASQFNSRRPSQPQQATSNPSAKAHQRERHATTAKMPIKRVETGSQIPLSAVLKEEVDHAAIAVAADDNEVSVVFHAICVECDDKKLLDSVSRGVRRGARRGDHGAFGSWQDDSLNVLAGRTTTSIQVSGDVVIARAKAYRCGEEAYTGLLRTA